jgi:hypothetical protein
MTLPRRDWPGRTGASVRRIPLDESIDGVTADRIAARIAETIEPRTRVLTLTWVHHPPHPAFGRAFGRHRRRRRRRLELRAADLAFLRADGTMGTEPGRIEVLVGPSSVELQATSFTLKP